MNRRVLFVTTGLHTKWLYYSQALIRRHFPRGQRIVVDGTHAWSPLGFLHKVLKTDADYVVHVDEDCFLLDADPLNELIAWMDTRPEVALAGTPDGGVPYREHNPLACNLFFVVFKRKTVATLVKEHPKWRYYRCDEELADRVPRPPYLPIPEKVSFDDYERYYPFSWLILKAGYRIEYLRADLNARYWSTDVRWSGERERVMARHMWWLRDWMTLMAKPGRESNRQRYGRLERECLAPLLFGRHRWLATGDWFLLRLALDLRVRLSQLQRRRRAGSPVNA